MALTTAEVKDLGLTTRLQLSDKEIAGLQVELNNILEYVEHMKQLDLIDVEPTAHPVDGTDGGRADVPIGSLARDMLLMNAPESRDGAFVVPQIKAPGMSDASAGGSA